MKYNSDTGNLPVSEFFLRMIYETTNAKCHRRKSRGC